MAPVKAKKASTRGPGRPRKVIRGRKVKAPTPLAQSTPQKPPSSQPSLQTKRGRGRPRKVPATAHVNGAAVVIDLGDESDELATNGEPGPERKASQKRPHVSLGGTVVPRNTSASTTPAKRGPRRPRKIARGRKAQLCKPGTTDLAAGSTLATYAAPSDDESTNIPGRPSKKQKTKATPHDERDDQLQLGGSDDQSLDLEASQIVAEWDEVKDGELQRFQRFWIPYVGATKGEGVLSVRVLPPMEAGDEETDSLTAEEESEPTFHRFMDLPLEIRNMIYEELLVVGTLWDLAPTEVEDLYPYVADEELMKARFDLRYANAPDARRPESNIMLVSDTVCSEAVVIFFGRNHFVIPRLPTEPPSLNGLDLPFAWPIGTGIEHLIRSLSIAIDMRDIVGASPWMDLVHAHSTARAGQVEHNIMNIDFGLDDPILGYAHVRRADRLCRTWKKVYSGVLGLNLHFLQIDLTRCYCPSGCHRVAAGFMLDFVTQCCARRVEILGTVDGAERTEIREHFQQLALAARCVTRKLRFKHCIKNVYELDEDADEADYQDLSVGQLGED